MGQFNFAQERVSSFLLFFFFFWSKKEKSRDAVRLVAASTNTNGIALRIIDKSESK
jgi:hypothetical protein